MKPSQLIATLIALLAAIWILSGLVSCEKEEVPPAQNEQTIQQENAKKENAPMKVRVSDQKAAPFVNNIIITGRTAPSREVELKAEIEGQVTQIIYNEGDHVKKGETLAHIELRDRKARLSEAQELVKQREVQYNAAEELAEQGFSSKISLAQAAADYENAKAALSAAKSDLRKIQIKAPFDGIINDQMIEVGDYLSAGTAAFTIVDLDPLEIEAYVSERQIRDIRLGSITQAKSIEGDTLDGTVSFIAASADKQTRTFRIIVKVDNPDQIMKGGLTATLAIPAAEKLAHKISPSILTLNEAGKIGVKIVNTENIVEFIPVKILADNTDHMWIKGLPNQVRLITVGQEFVKNGQTVNPVPAEQKDGAK